MADLVQRANSTSVPACGGSAKACGETSGLASLRIAAREAFPSKTAVEIAVLAKIPLRTAEHWLAGRCRLNEDALARLLRSDFGFEFLVALIGEASPPWWRQCLRAMSVFAVRRRQKADARLIESLHDDDTAKMRRLLKEAQHEGEALARSIAKAEAALVHGDADFNRAHLDALRASGGQMGGALGGVKR